MTRQKRAPEFTKAEDNLLRELKQGKGLVWKSIHRQFTEVFPGRSVGALQMRYCTKLKSRA